jgi:DNA-directed RNA polymerase specialized sigma24 family protein
VGLDEAGLEAEAAALAAGAGDTGEDALAARTRTALLAGLGEAQRAVVTLHYLEDVPVLEVARLLGLPENTVKTHLARARAAMRETWRREAARGKGALRA